MKPEYLMIPTTGQGNVAGLCASLYALATHADCPAWIQAAAKELCRDYHVTPVTRVEGA